MVNAATVDHTSLSSSASHRRVQRSTTLNRKYVKKPTKVSVSESAAKARADDLRRRQALAEKINSERIAALKAGKSLRRNTAATTATSAASAAVATAIGKATVTPAAKAAITGATAPRPLATVLEKTSFSPATTNTAKKAKETAVESALKSVATMEKKSARIKLPKLSPARSLGVKKLLLAFGCAALAVGVLGYFISNNTQGFDFHVAAMSSGIEATYPKYVPRGYSLSDIISGDKTVSITFKDSENNSFTLSEEATTWDNETLEQTYVKETWGNNYTSIRENGLTIFISNSDAAWLNGNILYKIKASGFNLTKKQIKNIAANASK